jgi:lysyl-tRNA synthetase class 2
MNPEADWKPAANLAMLQSRAELLANIRRYFAGQKVLEVETPMISRSGNTDPEIQSLRTEDGGYLRTSPEFPLKRMLAAGSGDIYELGRVFRAAESGRHHAPEFTMLEWYRTRMNYHELMDDVAALVRFCGTGKFDHWPVQKISYRQLFMQMLGLDPFSAETGTLAQLARNNGIDGLELNRRQWLDLLISFVIQPALPAGTLTFIYDFPADQAALARIRPGTPPVAERFELYLESVELANGYQELSDEQEQRQRFRLDNKERSQRGQPEYEYDQRLLDALAHGLPDCAGVALGVDRLLMAMTGSEHLEDVLAFPASRA